MSRPFEIKYWAIAIIGLLILLASTAMFLASRYKRCPSDMILVVFGKVGEGQSARCIHGGGAMIWPLIPDCAFVKLTPLTIGIPLRVRCRCRTSA